MTLSDLKTYLTERKMAPLSDIAHHFDSDPDALRGMLEHWVRKGRVRVHQESGCQSNCCGGCSSHDNKEVYEWL
jgi:hypothetical protein